MVVYEKINFEAYRNDQYIWHKNIIALLYFILRRAEPHWNFCFWFRDAPDISRFSVVHMVKTHLMLENLRISGAFSGRSLLEKFQYSSAVPNINIVVQYYFSVKCIGHWCMLQNLFFHRTPLKISSNKAEITELPAGCILCNYHPQAKFEAR